MLLGGRGFAAARVQGVRRHSATAAKAGSARPDTLDASSPSHASSQGVATGSLREVGHVCARPLARRECRALCSDCSCQTHPSLGIEACVHCKPCMRPALDQLVASAPHPRQLSRYLMTAAQHRQMWTQRPIASLLAHHSKGLADLLREILPVEPPNKARRLSAVLYPSGVHLARQPGSHSVCWCLDWQSLARKWSRCGTYQVPERQNSSSTLPPFRWLAHRFPSPYQNCHWQQAIMQARQHWYQMPPTSCWVGPRRTSRSS